MYNVFVYYKMWGYRNYVGVNIRKFYLIVLNFGDIENKGIIIDFFFFIIKLGM